MENGGELQHIKRQVTVSCLPANLPDHIEIDVTALDIGDSLKVKEMKLPDGIAVLDPADAAVVAVAAIKVVKATPAEEEAAAAAAAAAEAEGAPAAEEKTETETEKEKGK